MKEKLECELSKLIENLFSVTLDVSFSRPESIFGDYSSNVALVLAGKLKRPASEIAAQIAEELKSELIKKIEVKQPGFLNVYLKDEVILEELNSLSNYKKTNGNKDILVEFGDPNPFKEMHLGHLYSSIVGDSISKLLEESGAAVKRLSYHGDVGLNVARWIWAIGRASDWNLDVAKGLLKDTKQPLGTFYAMGAKADEEDSHISEEIKKINVHIYKRDRKDINELYDYGRELSFKYFDELFDSIGIRYDKRYLESETSVVGTEEVNKNINTVFEKSDGAVVYKGEKVGLHTRVFINSKGLPTYEAKDLGLAVLKGIDYPKANRSIVITASEQTEYFKVMLSALKEINPELAGKTTHLAHGFLSLTTGKMSSRKGNVYSAIDLLSQVKEKVSEQYPKSDKQDEIYLSAVKYTFLRQRLGADIVFDVKESVGLEGNSGPYIQYAHARAKSILAKSSIKSQKVDNLESDERLLAFKITEYKEVVEKAVNELLPSHICTYLFELAQVFNSFYEKNRVLDHERTNIRLSLLESYTRVLKAGLHLLGISAPESL